jgi:predicted PolB exonuclease-like 3'-5' exonuclease
MLLKDYTHKIVSQCAVYNIPYIVINTNDKTEDQVFEEAFEYIQRLK